MEMLHSQMFVQDPTEVTHYLHMHASALLCHSFPMASLARRNVHPSRHASCCPCLSFCSSGRVLFSTWYKYVVFSSSTRVQHCRDHVRLGELVVRDYTSGYTNSRTERGVNRQMLSLLMVHAPKKTSFLSRTSMIKRSCWANWLQPIYTGRALQVFLRRHQPGIRHSKMVHFS